MNASLLLAVVLISAATALLSGVHASTQDASSADQLIAAAASGTIAKGADIDVTDWMGRTPLHWAVSYNGDVAAVELLLAKGADIGAKDEFGSTPLHWAARYSDAATVELLLAKGADVHAKDEDGDTPRDVAASLGRVWVLEVLDRALANPKAPGDSADEEGGHKDVQYASALDAQREVAG